MKKIRLDYCSDLDSARLFVMSDVLFNVLVRDWAVLSVVRSQNGGFWQAQFAVAVYVARASSGMMTQVC
jgi:hypothetical protein